MGGLAKAIEVAHEVYFLDPFKVLAVGDNVVVCREADVLLVIVEPSHKGGVLFEGVDHIVKRLRSLLDVLR